MQKAMDAVNRIKQILMGAPVSERDLQLLAQQYFDLCVEAQKRLEGCGQQLARGLRSEAIYAAEVSPPLLDLIGVLDCPDAPQWAQYVRQLALPAPPPFDDALVKMLDEEYEQQNGVEPLLNRYRRLCIGQAPATQRIAVLRKLRAAHPVNPNWPKDLQQLETLRFGEIRDALRAPHAITTQPIERYLHELTSPELVATPPDDLVAAVKRFHTQAKIAQFVPAMKRFADIVNDAYAAMNLESVESALSEMAARSSRDNLPVPPEIVAAVKNARTWAAQSRESLTRRSAFDQNCTQLSKQVEASKGVTASELLKTARELHSALQALGIGGYEVPHALSSKTLDRIAQLERSHRLRSRQRALVILVSVIVVASLAGAAGWFVLDRRERDHLTQEIDGYLNQNDFSTGRQRIAQMRKLRPDWINSDPVFSAVTRFERADVDEIRRASELSAAMDRLKKMEPDEAEFDTRIRQARELATSDTERQAINLIRSEGSAKKKQRQRTIDEQFRTSLDRIEHTYDAVHAVLKTRNFRQMPQYQELPAMLEQASKNSEASQLLRDRLQNLRKNYQGDLEKQSAYERMLDSLGEAQNQLPNLARYLAACNKLQADYPAESDIAPTKEWKAIIPHYEAVCRLGEAAANYRIHRASANSGLEPVDSNLVSMIADLRLEVETPYSKTFEFISARAKFVADFTKQCKPLRDQLDRPLISGVNEFTILPKGKPAVHYYSMETDLVDESNGSLHFKYLDDLHRLKDGSFFGTVVKKPQLAPHCVMAREIIRRLQLEQEHANWASSIPDIISYAINFRDANPRMRALLLKELCALNDAVGNPAELTVSLNRSIDELNALKVNSLAPDSDPKIKKALADIEKLTADLAPQLTSHLKNATTRQSIIYADIATLFRPLAIAAVVTRDPAGKPAVIPLSRGAASQKPRELWIIELSRSSKRPEFRIVATLRDGPTPAYVWVDESNIPSVGQPLLAPFDGESTLQRARAAGLTPAVASTRPGWPVNLELIRE